MYTYVYFLSFRVCVYVRVRVRALIISFVSHENFIFLHDFSYPTPSVLILCCRRFFSSSIVQKCVL